MEPAPSRHELPVLSAPSERRAELLLRRVRPELDSWVASGEILGWDFQLTRFGAPGESDAITLAVHASPERSAGVHALSGRLAGRLAGLASLEPGPPVESLPDEASLKRFGGPEGIALLREFEVADTRLVRDLMALERHGDALYPLRAGLASVFFLVAALGLPEGDRGSWMATYVRSQGKYVSGDADKWCARFLELATETRSSRPEVPALLRAFSAGDWGDLEPAFGPAAPGIASLGRRLWAIRDRFPPKRPLEFSLLHTYLHFHLMRLGIDIFEETHLIVLAGLAEPGPG
jgi:hypothetical protein